MIPQIKLINKMQTTKPDTKFSINRFAVCIFLKGMKKYEKSRGNNAAMGR